MTPEEKDWIDNASYEELLELWRFAPAGSPWFIRETGEYYTKIMRQKEHETSSGERIKASKRVGWE